MFLSPEGGASKTTTYSVFVVSGFLFAQQFAQQSPLREFVYNE